VLVAWVSRSYIIQPQGLAVTCQFGLELESGDIRTSNSVLSESFLFYSIQFFCLALMAWLCSGKSNADLITNMAKTNILRSDRVAAVRIHLFQRTTPPNLPHLGYDQSR
jgi:hypothetical protein